MKDEESVMKKIVVGLLILLGAGSSAAAQVSDCGCEDKPLPEILGVVNGVKITKQDLSAETRARVEQLQRQVVDARQRELDLQIDTILLETEAKKRGVTPSQLIEDEVIARAASPTEADAQAFYEKNKASFKTEFKDEKNRILEYLGHVRQQEQAQKFAGQLRSTAQLKVLSRPSAPPASNADRARVLAIVNDKRITMGDIENSLRPLIASVQDQVYAVRKQDLELKINDMLLAQEAQKKGVTTRALLEAEVDAKVPPVTNAEAEAFYEENKERISGEFSQTKAQIIQYMRQRKEREAILAFAEKLRRASRLEINLTAPQS